MHNCKCDCQHEHIKFCAHCRKPFCQDCGKEWAEPCNLYHGYFYGYGWPYTYTWPNGATWTISADGGKDRIDCGDIAGDLTGGNTSITYNAAAVCNHGN